MIVLASNSASRQAMLTAAGVAFEARPANIDERQLEADLADAEPRQLVVALAEAKALALGLREADRLVLGSDSLVIVKGRRFDKPASREEAAEHLRRFSGREMQLHSGAALARGGAIVWRHAAVAKLQVRELSKAFINAYLDAEWPEVGQCVGAFRIEGRGAQLFEWIDGDMFTVLGMPLLAVLGALREFGELEIVSRAYAEVIGDPIAQSKSPAIHTYWLKKLGIDAEYRACRVTENGLADYLAARRGDPDWRGCNVTMPHKQAVIPLLDRLDPLAARIGAVNTIVREADGSLTGHNTDVAGFLEPLRELLARQHLFRMARIVGTGGAARAIVAALADEGFAIVLAGRNPVAAAQLLDELAPGGEHHPASLAHFAESTDFAFGDRAGCLGLVVNASPLGMEGRPPLAFDFSHAPPGSVVYDIVTAPAETGFLEAARAAGFETIDGLAMLIGQAAAAFKMLFGLAPPREDGDAELRRLLTQ